MKIPRKLGGCVAHIECEHIFSGILDPFCGMVAIAQSFAVTFNKHQQLEGASKKKTWKLNPVELRSA